MAPSGDTQWPLLGDGGGANRKIARKPVPVRSSTQYTDLTIETPLETSQSSPDAEKKWMGRTEVRERNDSTDGGRGTSDEKVADYATWRPQWLRPFALVCFAGLFLCVTIALPVMLWYSERNDGIAKTRQDFGYVWRFGPTAVLTLVAAFWARVELQSMRYMPWIALRRGQALDPDLDYTAMLMPAVLYQSLRRKHWLVFLVSFTSLLIRAEIVLAPGLFRLAPIQLSEPVVIQTRDSFNPNWNSTDSGRESVIAYYAARAIHDFDMTYPFGLTSEAAYQTFQLTRDGTRGTTSAPIKTEVDAFFSNMTCLKLEDFSVTNIKNLSLTTFQEINRETGSYLADVSLRFTDCEQDVPIRITATASQGALKTGRILRDEGIEDAWFIHEKLKPLPRPCPSLPQQFPQFLYYAGQFQRIRTGNTSRIEAETHGAVLCSPTAWLSKVEVIDDGVSPNITALEGRPTTPMGTNIWEIMGSIVPATPGGWRARTQGGENYGPATGEFSFSGTRNFSDTTELLYNTTISLTRRLAPLMGHYLFRADGEDEAVGEVIVSIDRLALNPQVCWAMIAVSAAITVIIFLALLRSRRYTRVWYRDPATILGSLLFLTDHSGLREASKRDDEDLKKKWSECDFSPLIIRPWAQVTFTVFVCGLLIGLGSTLQSSIENQGLANVDENGYWYLLWTSFPAMIMLGVSLYTSSNDFVLRNLSTLYSLSIRSCTSRQLDSSMLDMLGIFALFRASRQRAWTIATSQTMALACGILATLATVLFSVETIPNSGALQVAQKSWFGDVAIPENGSVYEKNREKIRSLLVQRGKANFTYPSNTYADMAFPYIDWSPLSGVNSTEESTIQVRMPAAKLTSSCQRLSEDQFNVTVSNYTEKSGQNTSETVYQGPMLTREKCPDGTFTNLGHLFIVGRNQTGNHPGTSYFADILDSPENLFDMNQSCRLNITDASDLLGPTLWKTYVFGQWNYVQYRFDVLRFWKCHYSWIEVMTDVNFVRAGNGEFTIDENNPPAADMSTARQMDPPLAVPVDANTLSGKLKTIPVLGTADPDIFISDPSAGDVNSFFRPLIRPYGKLPSSAFGDASMENVILDEIHANLAVSSAQLINLENRLEVGQDSRTAAFPSAGLPSVEAVVIDSGRRRLVQNATVTYVIIAILGLVACMNIWTLFSRIMRRYGVRWRWFSMDVRGLAPDGFGSIGLTASLLHDSNATQHIPAQSWKVSTSDVHGMLDDLRFRLGWFRMEADRSTHFTVGVLEDKGFGWVESKLEREKEKEKEKKVPKAVYQKVANTSGETGYGGEGGEVMDRDRDGGWI